MADPIYLDYAATTPVDAKVAERMAACLTREGNFANPASRSHVYGWRAEEAVEQARAQVAGLIKADPREIVWTSGATEATNLALKGAMQARGKGHLIVSAIEHKAGIDTALALEAEGFKVSFIAPQADGCVALERVFEAVQNDTVAVSLMHANNEVGSINDIASLGRYCREKGILLHCDAAQTAGKIDIDVAAMQVDLMSLSAHKFYGPKGMGALYVRRHPSVKINAQIHGGGHERGLRSGTLATHQIVGMGLAAEIASQAIDSEGRRIAALKAKFLEAALAIEGVDFNGSQEHSLPGIANLSVADLDAETLMMSLRNLALSSGSACTSASLEPSYVLKAMGRSDAQAHASLRFSFGRFTSDDDIDIAIQELTQSIAQLRGLRT
jgi:cysteine desulfurase